MSAKSSSITSLIKVLFLMHLLCFSVKAQQSNLLVSKIDEQNKKLPKEKLYLSFDKPHYSIGDTIYFKSFLLNNNNHQNTISDKIYVELFNENAKLIERKLIALNNGLGYGDFTLTKELSDGTYLIRAYTNWQQNFGADYLFQKTIYIGNYAAQPWLLTTHHKLDSSDRKNKLLINVKLTNLKNEAIGLRDLDIFLTKDSRKITSASLQTQLDGTFLEQVILPDQNLSGIYHLAIQDKKDKTKKATIPIVIDDDIDLQFMPEGGYMINNINGKVAFKATGPDGLGRPLSGHIVNDKNESLSTFNTVHKGMGSFYLLPKKEEKYFAIYNLNGKAYKKSLPMVKDEGTTLRIDHLSKLDSVFIYVKSNGSFKLENYQLIVQAADEVLFALSVNLKNGFSTFKLSKKDFPDGIIHFTLFSPTAQALNERQAFINYNQKIALNVEKDKAIYAPRDSISIELNTKTESGFPLSGSFAVTITDDAQVKQSKNEDHIVSHFLIQSEIKGNIEDAAWYFNNSSASTALALDHLLLTQGWIGYRWIDVLQRPMDPKFKAEKDNLLEGQITNALKKPISNINLTLLSLGKDIFVLDTLSNEEGKFAFKLPMLDTSAYVVKIRKPNGKTSGANIMVNEFSPSLIIPSIKPINPWYMNSADSTLLNAFKMGNKRVTDAEKSTQLRTGKMLKEIEVVGSKKNMLTEATWDARFLKKIGEEELKKNGRKKVFDLLKEALPGLTWTRFWQTCGGGLRWHKNEFFVVGTRLISWVRIDNILPPDPEAVEYFIKNYLAEDIKEIAIYTGCVTYYIDITTRSGKGPWAGRSIGTYVHRPIPINIGKEFYSPKYAADKNSTIPDFRSTIFWDANVVTDENGKAKLSFYAADQPGTYNIKIEGTDLQGRFGYHKSTIQVKSKIGNK